MCINTSGIKPTSANLPMPWAENNIQKEPTQTRLPRVMRKFTVMSESTSYTTVKHQIFLIHTYISCTLKLNKIWKIISSVRKGQ